MVMDLVRLCEKILYHDDYALRARTATCALDDGIAVCAHTERRVGDGELVCSKGLQATGNAHPDVCFLRVHGAG